MRDITNLNYLQKINSKKTLQLLLILPIVSIGIITVLTSLELQRRRNITAERVSADSQISYGSPPPVFAYFNQASSWRMGEPFYKNTISQLPTNQTSSDYLECATGKKVGNPHYPGCQGGDWSEQTTRWYVLAPKNLNDPRVQEEFKKIYQAAEQAKPGRSIIIDIKYIFYDCGEFQCTFAASDYASRWSYLVSIINEPRIASFAIDEPFWTYCYSKQFHEDCVNTQIGHLNNIISTIRSSFPHSGILFDTNPSSVACMDAMNIKLSGLTNGCNDLGSCILLGLNAQNRVNSFDDLGITGVNGSSACLSYESTGIGYDDWFAKAQQLFGIYEPARLYAFSAGTLTQSMRDFCTGKPWPCAGNEDALKHYIVRQLDYAENNELAGVIPWEWDNWGSEAKINNNVHIADSMYHIRPLYECWSEYVTTGNDYCWRTKPGYENWYPDPARASCSDNYYVDCVCSNGISGRKLCHKQGYLDPNQGNMCKWGRNSYCEECKCN